MNVVIVESPAKAKTINKYLGSNYTVLASYGHVRDLPSKDGSVEPDNDFAMSWEVDAQSGKRLNDIAKAVKGAEKLILATDPDREGEAISWHVLDILNKKNALKDVAVERVVFNAITKKSILEAMENPRGIDQELVDAYLARRALDYLVGFTLSPVLWRKLPGSRSAGRVQSVTLRLICDRELEIEAFRAQEYWTVEAALSTTSGDALTARLVSLDGKKLDKFDLADESTATKAVQAIQSNALKVLEVTSKPANRYPAPPFTTSTLQQEASRKLGFTASRTMQVAQRLYEGVEMNGETVGLITYMRTDGVQIAPEAMGETRHVIEEQYGKDYLPESPRAYRSKAKNAQEAHEAIRPTSLSRLPEYVRGIDSDQRRLYELIWKRTIASQMQAAQFERTTIEIGNDAGAVGLRATGQVLIFDGFLKLYQEGVDDEADSEDGGRLPKVNEADPLDQIKIEPSQHFTEPPPRYSEATLVKKLEELGIGRPSTYASILSVLKDRAYVRMEKKRFHPEDKGRLVTAFLESFFTKWVEYDFTAGLEEQLDEVSDGKLQYKDFLRNFWTDFTANVDDITDLRISEVLDALNEILAPHVFPPKEDGTDPRKCPSCETGQLSLKVGRFGAFVGCSDYPECKFTRPLTPGEGDAAEEDKVLGPDPETGLDITLKNGRFGPYVQVGEAEDGNKPKRAGIPKDKPFDEVDYEYALKLLALPREVGTHPETGKKITAGIGRYGPFVLHDRKYANLENSEEAFTVGVNRAVTVLAEKAAKGGGRSSSALKEVGDHPESGKPVRVMDGRFGPYIKYQKINATLPKDVPPESVTMEMALELIAKKEAKGPAKKKATKKKAAKKKTAKKKTATKKKTAKKKTATKKKPAAKKAAKTDG
ncbi:MAG: type I DNA topoisomerase [Alphaproteobacteria bacterium]|nr:MAG: type I DNA topoisomerase [Alphaproteobacteria bacterium]